MRFSYIQQIVEYMQRFTHIISIYRYDDMGLRVVFDRQNHWNFDMQRGNSSISIGEETNRGKVYQAPFDVLLAKRLNRATIHSIEMINDDKIIRLTVGTSGSYKSETTILQFEFTGKHTNVILLDKDEVVLEALRHIDDGVSSRSIKVGQILAIPPKPPYLPQSYPLEDVREFLINEYQKGNQNKLERLKNEKKALLEKRLTQLHKHFDALEDENILYQEAQRFQHYGHLILAHLNTFKPYQQSITVNDFDGIAVTFELPSGCSHGSVCADIFFKRSKKTKQKALGLYQERNNLQEKIHHLELFIQTVSDAKNPEEIALLFPQKRSGNKLKTSDSIAEFWIEGVKVSLGKSEKGNIELLKNAKARDIWIHLKDIPSAHVIISTDKQQLPDRLIEAAAKLCVDFSVFEKGRYLVDYTPRREVKIQERSNVLYTNFKTICIEK